MEGEKRGRRKNESREQDKKGRRKEGRRKGGEEERERRGEVVGRTKVASRNCLTTLCSHWRHV